MPNAVLWGVMAAILNFIPFLGAMVGVVIMALAAIITMDSMTQIIAVPAISFLLTSIEGNFVTPTILGRRFTVNPIVLFVWTVLWGWIWGVPGALLAVPLLMALKITFDHVPQLCWISDLISYKPVIAPPSRKKEEPEENCAIHIAPR
jgi:predicted PurR-regulated permease PerM